MTKPATEERVAHTPTPWKHDQIFPTSIWANDVWLGSTNVDTAKLEQNEANAAFIVTACNAHEALVDALRALYAGIPDYLRNDVDGFRDELPVQIPVLMGAIRKARAALSLATQKGDL